jgi:hypothetical protein
MTQSVLPILETSREQDEALFQRFLDSDVHKALSVCLDLRPPVSISVLA